MNLYINTVDAKKITVGLKDNGQMVTELSDENQFGSQVLLPLITQVLDQQQLTWQDLAAVEVETGPGSYTGVRVGVSVANAIGMGLKILVNGKPYETDIKYN